MLEQVREWMVAGGAYLTVAAGFLVIAIPVAVSTVKTIKSLKEVLPTKVQDSIDGKLNPLTTDINDKLDIIKNTTDKFTLQKTIIDCKAKLYSTVASIEIKEDNFALMNQAQQELKDVYGIIIEVPASIPNVEVI